MANKNSALVKKDEVLVSGAQAIENALVGGDLAGLSVEDRMIYFKQVCESLGLNPLTRPFDFQTFNGKTILYARKDCTEQLRKIHGVSVIRLEKDTSVEGLVIYTASLKDKDGREDIGTGAVSIKGLQGENLANAIMKAETKAKRRGTLSLCGLGILDETEIDSMRQEAREASTGTVETKALPEAIVAPTMSTTAAPDKPSGPPKAQIPAESSPSKPTEAHQTPPVDALPDTEPDTTEPETELSPEESNISDAEFDDIGEDTKTAPEADRPVTQAEFMAFCQTAKNITNELSNAGLKASAKITAGEKVKRFFLKTNQSVELKNLTHQQWCGTVAELRSALAADKKKAVELVEERIK